MTQLIEIEIEKSDSSMSVRVGVCGLCPYIEKYNHARSVLCTVRCIALYTHTN